MIISRTPHRISFFGGGTDYPRWYLKNGGLKIMTHHILITGGAGYLGSVLVPELLKLGHKVTVLDTFMFGQNSLLECCADNNFDVIRGDARDEDTLKPLLKKADYIILLAALVGAPLCSRDKSGTVTTNRDAVELIVRLASKEQRIIYPCTNSRYSNV